MPKIDDFKKKIDSFIPYLATFYYMEIIYLMIFLNFLYGKIVSVSAGLLLTFFLTLHIIRLFIKRDINRKIQLYVMDIHIAYSVAYIINRFFSGSDLTYIDKTVVLLRFMTLCIEIIAVISLTDSSIKKTYSD